MMEVENLAQRPLDWNGFYYTVIHGLKPGIYWSWSVFSTS
jgi:viroplasmin and RNaseH domain-containing protein